MSNNLCYEELVIIYSMLCHNFQSRLFLVYQNFEDFSILFSKNFVGSAIFFVALTTN